jgi:hypothetical protein
MVERRLQLPLNGRMKGKCALLERFNGRGRRLSDTLSICIQIKAQIDQLMKENRVTNVQEVAQNF